MERDKETARNFLFPSRALKTQEQGLSYDSLFIASDCLYIANIRYFIQKFTSILVTARNPDDRSGK